MYADERRVQDQPACILHIYRAGIQGDIRKHTCPRILTRLRAFTYTRREHMRARVHAYTESYMFSYRHTCI